MVLHAVAKNRMGNDGCQVRSFSQLHACNTEDTGEQKPERSGREGDTTSHPRPDAHMEGRGWELLGHWYSS